MFWRNVLKGLPWLIIAGLILFSVNYLYQGVFQPPVDSPTGDYTLQIIENDTLDSVSKRLQQDKVLYNAELASLVSRFTVQPSLKPGSYNLKLPASPSELWWQIQNQTPSLSDNTVSVTLIEGDTAEDMADKLNQAEVIESVEFLNYIQNPNNFQNSKYEFLPSVLGCKYGDIYQNCPKYYLEGYLMPDTYTFFKNSESGLVIDKFLQNFNQKFWLKNRDYFGDDLVKAKQKLYMHLILSSVVEREVGRNFIKAAVNDTDLNQERSKVAGVYLNRLEQKMKWQADPTVWYGVDRKKGVPLDGDLNWGSEKYLTGYNTYQNVGYPVGPIANPGWKTLQAVLSPTESDYLFFVSDRSGKMYFGKTLAEHNQNIVKVRQINQGL